MTNKKTCQAIAREGYKSQNMHVMLPCSVSWFGIIAAESNINYIFLFLRQFLADFDFVLVFATKIRDRPIEWAFVTINILYSTLLYIYIQSIYLSLGSSLDYLWGVYMLFIGSG